MTDIVGLDTDTHGWYAVRFPGAIADKGTSPDKNIDVRRMDLYLSAKLYFETLPGDTHVFCEEPLAVRNGKTTRALALAGGAIWAAHLGSSIFWHWVNISHWKKEVVGNGNASKDQIVEWVAESTGNTVGYEDQDHYDAYCLGVYGEQSLAALDKAGA